MSTDFSKNPWNAALIRDPQDPRLHIKAKRVKQPRSTETLFIVQVMKALQQKYNGIGLAAPQIGINRRIITVLNDNTGKIIEFINPKIVSAVQDDSNVAWGPEGCLSHPGINGEVARYKTIMFTAQRLCDSKEQTFQVSGLMSIIIQHEIDHCNGLLYTDLGPEVRNITFDKEGQSILFDATKENEEHGYQDFKID